ncbi:MAG: aldo/keto reductase [Candidatus Aminicenantes bacterium]|nr:MAG: aldo/keto reductase [Candidatus Aminicenantes bacterium]
MREKTKIKGRRNFIKTGLTGLTGAILAPTLTKKDKSLLPPQKKDRKFIYRTLGKTGIKLPIVSMGTYDATGVTNLALDAGIVHIDTSADYNEGNDERMFGQVIKNRPHDSIVIGTSIGMWQFRQAEQIKNAISVEKLREYIEGSLERLDMDTIDIYYLGGVQHKEIAEHEPYLKVLTEYKKAGKLRFLGVTTHKNEPEIIRAATDSGVYDVILTAYNFRKTNRDEIKEAVAYAAGKGMGIVAMKTQAGVYWDTREKKKMINMKAALKWALQDENIHTAIPSFKNSDQLYEALSVMENLELTPQEKADLQLNQGNSSTGLFCSQCEKCVPQCPANLDIPTLMRSYMYAYGYERPAKARKTLDHVDLSHIPCIDCDTCSVVCASGFDIKRKVTDIARLKDVPEEFLAG